MTATRGLRNERRDNQRLLNSRARLTAGIEPPARQKGEEEGAAAWWASAAPSRCGPSISTSRQGRCTTRGKRQGRGRAALGFVPEQLGVTRQVLDDCYMLQIAHIDPAVREDVERKYVATCFDVAASNRLDTVEDWTSVPDLEVRPPDVYRYFVRVKPAVLDSFVAATAWPGWP